VTLDWDPETHLRVADEAWRTFREHGAERLVPFALLRILTVELRRGRIARMLDLATEAFAEARDGRDRRWVALSLAWAMAALEYGPPPLSEGLEIADGHLATFRGERAIEGMLLPERAMIAAWLGRAEQARADLAAGRTIQLELGSRSDEWYYVMVDGCIAWADGDPVRADARFREASRWLADHDDVWSAGYLGPPHARVLLELGRDRAAEAMVRAFRDHRHYPMARIAAPSITAVISARRGDLDEALRLSVEAEALAAVTDLPIEQAYVALERAEILLLAGRHAEARTAAEEALARLERKEYVIGIRRARGFLATLPV
jgi:tetratricopeptide (TPR) repeat protein